MTALLQAPTHSHDDLGTAARPEPTLSLVDLRQLADRLGQLDVGDERWTHLEGVLDLCLREAVSRCEDPRALVWRRIAADPASARVVRLRTFAAALATLD